MPAQDVQEEMMGALLVKQAARKKQRANFFCLHRQCKELSSLPGLHQQGIGDEDDAVTLSASMLGYLYGWPRMLGRVPN